MKQTRLLRQLRVIYKRKCYLRIGDLRWAALILSFPAFLIVALDTRIEPVQMRRSLVWSDPVLEPHARTNCYMALINSAEGAPCLYYSFEFSSHHPREVFTAGR